MISSDYLVRCARYALDKGFVYWYGTFGSEVCSQDLFNRKKKQYPNYYDQLKYKVSFAQQIKNKDIPVDCAGLLKFALMQPDYSKIGFSKYNPTYDLSANGYITNGCSQTGAISSIPEIPGIIVWKEGHLGIYVGSGKVIEARGHDYGVVMTDLNSRGWQKWGKCKWVTYATTHTYTAEQAMADIKNIVDKYYKK